MLGKIYNAVAILAIAHLLAFGGVLAYLSGSGRLSGERFGQIVDLLRGADDDAAESDAAPTGDEVEQEPPARAASTAEVREQRRAQQVRRAALERAVQDVSAQRELLDRVLQDQIEKREQFNAAVRNWEETKRKQLDEARDAGFQRELEYFSKLPPKQGKEVLLRKWKKSPADAVRMLNAVKTNVGQAIFEQMKSAQETEIMFELLEQLSRQDIDRFVPGTGRPSGDASK